jgi:hypothetical protein
MTPKLHAVEVRRHVVSVELEGERRHVLPGHLFSYINEYGKQSFVVGGDLFFSLPEAKYAYLTFIAEKSGLSVEDYLSSVKHN